MIPITVIQGEGFIFNLDHVKELREKHRITGVLVGVLPQYPQQNVFMGLPVLLTPEETKYLVDEKIGYLVQDTELHEHFCASGNATGPQPEAVPMASEAHDTDVERRLVARDSPVTVTEPHQNAYAMFRYLVRNEFYCAPGIRFGCHFLAYPGDPLRYHAHFSARGLGWDEQFDVLDIVGSGRLATAVKKCWVVGGEDPQEEYHAFSVEWAGFG